MKDLAKNLWKYSGWIVAIWSAHKQIQQMNELKNEFYETMGPAEQARWDSIFGRPTATVVTTPLNIVEVEKVAGAKPLSPTMEQVEAGT